MEKRYLKKNQKATSLTVRTETLRRLDDTKLQEVAGGGRLRVPIGIADDTTPIYGDTDG